MTSDIELISQIISEPDDINELRLIHPDGRVEKGWAYAKELPTLEVELRELNEQGWNIYYGPNPRKEFEKSGDSNVLLARCLFCDFDNIDPDIIAEIDKKLRHFPEPSLYVHSGHGLHVYWRLTEPILDMAFWRSVQTRLNAFLGADPAIKNFERIMRLPGFLNTKREPFVPCSILGDTGGVCSLSSFTAVLDGLPAQQQPLPKPKPALPLPKPAATSRLTDNDYAERKARAILYVAKALGAAQGNRNAAAFKLTARLRELFNLTDDDLLDILNGWNSKNTPPLDSGELASIVNHVGNYAKQPAGSGYELVKKNVGGEADYPKNRVMKRRSFADISPKMTKYLIPELLPSGVIVSLISQEGVGKSTLAGHFAAVVSHGMAWTTGGDVQQGDVVLFSHEESPECSISPRLRANGADMGRVHLAESVIAVNGDELDFDIERDIQILDDWADELPGLRLVIFDPITSYVNCNENSNSEVRRALKPLVDFAARRGVTILALSHLSKKVDLGMINRTLGSRAWSSVPRIIWGLQAELVEDDDGHKVDTGSRFLLCVKCNLGKKPKGLKFSIKDAGLVAFDTERVSMDIDEAGGIEASRSNEIGDWLIKKVGVDTVPAAEIIKEGCQRWGISPQRLGEIAKKARIIKQFSATENRWVWSVKQ